MSSHNWKERKDTKWREAADVHSAFDIIGSGVPWLEYLKGLNEYAVVIDNMT